MSQHVSTYQLQLWSAAQNIFLPGGSTVIHAELTNGMVTIWVLCGIDPGKDITFEVVCDGGYMNTVTADAYGSPRYRKHVASLRDEGGTLHHIFQLVPYQQPQ